MAVDGRAAELIAVADRVKEDSVAAVRRLHELGPEVVMLTGDNERTARAIARRVALAIDVSKRTFRNIGQNLLGAFFYNTLGIKVAAGIQEVFIRVKGGYEPDLVVLEAGRPARLHFQRRETAACSEMVVFPGLGISRKLPAGERVSIELGPREPGEYPFACQMGMLRGRLVVTPDGPPSRESERLRAGRLRARLVTPSARRQGRVNEP